MAKTYLGETIDIHAGGIDHIPIHHTNEIAQSESANGVEFARIWLHGEFMKINGNRMGKSLGNFLTLDDLKEKGYTPIDFRTMVIQSHYKTESNFSFDNLEAAKNRLSNLKKMAELRWQTDDSENKTDKFSDIGNKFRNALLNDLNTPKALKLLADASDIAQGGLSNKSVQSFIELLQVADKTLGLRLLESTPDINQSTKDLLKLRAQARDEGDWGKSDEIRNKLEAMNLSVLDSKNKQIWHKSD